MSDQNEEILRSLKQAIRHEASIYFGGNIDLASKLLQDLPFLVLKKRTQGGVLFETIEGVKGRVILHRALPETGQSKAEINFVASKDPKASQEMVEIRDLLLKAGFDV